MHEGDTHARYPFLNAERRADIIVGPQIKGMHFVAFPAIARKDNDGHARAHSDLLADLQAVAAGSIKTEQ